MQFNKSKNRQVIYSQNNIDIPSPLCFCSVVLFLFKGQELVKICGISLSIKKTATLEGCMKVCVCPGTLDDSVAAEYGYSGICYACDLWDMGL